MNTVIEEVKPWLEILENTIFLEDAAPSDFEKTFCAGNELLEVAFSSNSLIVYFLASNGATISDTFTLQEFSDWLDKED